MKFCTTDPEWEKVAQALRGTWNKGTEQFCAHTHACVSPLKQNDWHTPYELFAIVFRKGDNTGMS